MATKKEIAVSSKKEGKALNNKTPNGRRSARSLAVGEGTKTSPQKGEDNLERSPQWKPFITMYYTSELRALKFPSVKELERATCHIWHDSEFADMPLDTPDGITLIVPEAAEGLLESKGLKFKPSDVLSLSDLDPEARAELRQDYFGTL